MGPESREMVVCYDHWGFPLNERELRGCHGAVEGIHHSRLAPATGSDGNPMKLSLAEPPWRPWDRSEASSFKVLRPTGLDEPASILMLGEVMDVSFRMLMHAAPRA